MVPVEIKYTPKESTEEEPKALIYFGHLFIKGEDGEAVYLTGPNSASLPPGVVFAQELNPMTTRVITDPDDVEELLFGDTYREITEEEIVGDSRWSLFKEQMLREVATGKYFLVEWEEGATEYREVDTSYALIEVEPYETIVTKYRKVTKD